jgi:hypothetical protein
MRNISMGVTTVDPENTMQNTTQVGRGVIKPGAESTTALTTLRVRAIITENTITEKQG